LGEGLIICRIITYIRNSKFRECILVKALQSRGERVDNRGGIGASIYIHCRRR
jgi:hypothetical protein